MRMAVTEEALQVRVNGELKTVGKVIAEGIVGGKKIFYRNYSWGTAYFKKWRALSFDVRVVQYLRDNEVSEIHYETKEGNLYVVSTEDFVKKAKDGNWGEGDQMYLSVDEWRITRRDYPTKWTTKVLEIV